MKSEELSKEIEQYQQKAGSLISHMDGLCIKIRDAMPIAAASWINKEVERQIIEKSDIVQSLGIEKLKELKNRLKNLTEKLPEIVKVEIEDRSKWPHYTETLKTTVPVGEPYFNKVFRNVISSLGSILNEFGLIIEVGPFYTSWQRSSNGGYYYAINVGPETMPEEISEYNRILMQYKSLGTKIAQSQKLLSEAK